MIGIDPRLGTPREVECIEITCEVTLKDDQARKLIAIAKRLGQEPAEAFADLVQAMLGGAKPKREKPAVVIPAWVPEFCRDDYRAIAESEGEEAAASYARARKREASA